MYLRKAGNKNRSKPDQNKCKILLKAAFIFIVESFGHHATYGFVLISHPMSCALLERRRISVTERSERRKMFLQGVSEKFFSAFRMREMSSKDVINNEIIIAVNLYSTTLQILVRRFC